jgi:hypothetical protein
MKNVRILNMGFDGGDAQQGFTIRRGGLTGLDGVEMRSQSEEIAQQHGEFELPGFLAARTVTISGLCLADSDFRLGQFKAQLTGLLADGDSAPVVFDYLGIKGWGRAQRIGKPEFEVTVPGSIAEYSLELKFADPRLYGESRILPLAPAVRAAAVTAYHYGNFTAAPVLTIYGAQTGYTVTGPGGRQFVVTRVLTAANPHTIDMRTGYLIVAGNVQMGYTPIADTWGIPAGAQVEMSVSGGATMTATVPDTST